MLCWQHPRTGMTQYAVCGALALCVISLVVLVPVKLAAAAPRAQASSDCSASITVQLAGVRQTANGIVTRKVSCAAARTVLRSFLQRADRQPSCRSAALQPPPTSGCLVSGYHCFLRVAVNYCATPSGREFGWTLRVASAKCAIASGDRPFVQGITARGVVCSTAQAAIRAWLHESSVTPFQAAGRQWTQTRSGVLRGYPPVVGNTQRMRTNLRSGRVEVVVLSLPYG